MLLVVAGHVWGLPAGGHVGVDVFFVLSGFLITGLLLREHARTGRIDLREFYARRVRRLLPAAALVLATTNVAAWLRLLRRARRSGARRLALGARAGQRALRRARHRLLRRHPAALAGAALLVARGRGAVLPRVAVPAAGPARAAAATRRCCAAVLAADRRVVRLVGRARPPPLRPPPTSPPRPAPGSSASARCSRWPCTPRPAPACACRRRRRRPDLAGPGRHRRRRRCCSTSGRPTRAAPRPCRCSPPPLAVLGGAAPRARQPAAGQPGQRLPRPRCRTRSTCGTGRPWCSARALLAPGAAARRRCPGGLRRCCRWPACTSSRSRSGARAG